MIMQLDETLPLMTEGGEPLLMERVAWCGAQAQARAYDEREAIGNQLTFPDSTVPLHFFACHPDTWNAMSDTDKARFKLIK